MPGKRIIGGFFCAFFMLAAVVAVSMRDIWLQENVLQESVLLENVLQEGALQENVLQDTQQENPAEELQLYATSAVLMDAASGRVLYSKASDVPMAMASTTKIMTCILVLENGNLDDVASVSSYASSMPKVKLSVHKGEQYQVRDLLYSLMLESHNDSAVVLAEYIGKRLLPEELAKKDTAEYTVEESRQAVEAFAALMNERALELGCENTWFITPNGLDATQTVTDENGQTVQKEHQTTAEELARIMAYCILESPQKDAFLQITRTANYSFAANERSFSCVNHNAFLTMMDGALSGKTGFTNKAGYCYVGALERDERTYVVALLACGWPNNKTYKWSDARELMEYGLENYFFRNLTEGKDELIDEKLFAIPVLNGQTQVLGEMAYTEVEKLDAGKGLEGLLLKENEAVEVFISQEETLVAPVREGMVVGRVCYIVDDMVYRVEDIVTTEAVDAISRKWCFEQIIRRFLP